jgi:hypothetical protein
MTRARHSPELVMTAPMLSLCAGTTCIGFILNRGKSGFELFDHNDKSRGTFATLHEAVSAIPRTADEAES